MTILRKTANCRSRKPSVETVERFFKIKRDDRENLPVVSWILAVIPN
jgi:hypothetical protein